MSQVRENLHRIICSSNLRQLGLSTSLDADDYRDCLPYRYIFSFRSLRT